LPDGVDKKDSQRWQRLARIGPSRKEPHGASPDGLFDAAIRGATARLIALSDADDGAGGAA
jgi:hypothetical protein